MNESLVRMTWRSGVVALLLALAAPVVFAADADASARAQSAPQALHPASDKAGVPVAVAYRATGSFAINTPMQIELTLTPLDAVTAMRVEIPESGSFVVDVDRNRLMVEHPTAGTAYKTVLQVTPRGSASLFRFLVIARKVDAQFVSAFTIDLRRANAKPASTRPPKTRASSR